MTVKRHSSGQVSSPEAVSYTEAYMEGCPLTLSDDDDGSSESPETSDVSKKEVMIRKIIIECESRYVYRDDVSESFYCYNDAGVAEESSTCHSACRFAFEMNMS